jgi:hypothetical protein
MVCPPFSTTLLWTGKLQGWPPRAHLVELADYGDVNLSRKNLACLNPRHGSATSPGSPSAARAFVCSAFDRTICPVRDIIDIVRAHVACVLRFVRSDTRVGKTIVRLFFDHLLIDQKKIA